MQTNLYNQQMAIQLDLKGNIKKVILNTFNDIILQEGNSVVHLFANESLQTFFENFSNTLNNQISIGARVLLSNFQEVFMFMVKNQDDVTLFTISMQEEIISLFDEIVKFNNEQIKSVRQLYKKISKNEENQGFFEEILLVNNAYTNARREISVQKRQIELMEKELEELSYKDFLTQLSNRNKFFYDVYPLVLQREYYLVRINIINFDTINEQFGHQNGDELLCDISRELNMFVESYSGFAYRMWGDEFIILVPTFVETSIKEMFDNCMLILKKYDNNLSIAYGVVALNQSNCMGREQIEEVLKEAKHQIIQMKKEYHSAAVIDRRVHE